MRLIPAVQPSVRDNLRVFHLRETHLQETSGVDEMQGVAQTTDRHVLWSPVYTGTLRRGFVASGIGREYEAGRPKLCAPDSRDEAPQFNIFTCQRGNRLWPKWPYGCSAGHSQLLMSSESFGASQRRAEFHSLGFVIGGVRRTSPAHSQAAPLFTNISRHKTDYSGFVFPFGLLEKQTKEGHEYECLLTS